MKMLVVATILLLSPFASNAEWKSHFKHRHNEHRHNNSSFWQGVEDRQYQQMSRIERGVGRGQLTRRELKKLKREQKHIAKQVKHMKRHNYLSERDKGEVLEHLDYVSNKIRSLKHNEHYTRRNSHSAHRSNHSGRGHKQYIHSSNSRVYRNDRYLTWANDDSALGLFLRF